MCLASDKTAIAGWIFMAIWLSFLCLFTWLFIRDGGFHQFAPPLEAGILLLFWLFGIAGARHMFGTPIVTLCLDGVVFVLRERWLRGHRESRFEVTDESRPAIRKIKDSEGDDRYLLEVRTAEGRRVAVCGYGDREDATDALSAMDRIIGHG